MNFIEKYDGVLNSLECESLIDVFERWPYQQQATAGGIVDPNLKIGTSVELSFNGENPVNGIVFPAIEKCIDKYTKKYPLMDYLGAWHNQHNYHIQRFRKNEGYFRKHCEQAHISVSGRILVWMIYLNNARSGTRFYHQKIDMKAKAGRLVIWPAAWTHTHSGIIPNRGNKYIITGWFELF